MMQSFFITFSYVRFARKLCKDDVSQRKNAFLLSYMEFMTKVFAAMQS